MDALPSSLYKYLPPERASGVIGELLIRFSQASVMNDIEEYKPRINGIAAEADFELKFRKRANELYPGLMDLVEKQGPEYMIKVHNQAERDLPKTLKKIYDMTDRNFGILSLSEDPTSACMWRRYADEGRGFLAEFDPSHSWFRQKIQQDDDFRHLRRVEYAANRAPTFLFAASAQDYLYTKEERWECEKEWRIILNFNSAACRAGKDTKGADVLLFAIPPDCLISVTTGYKASRELCGQIRTAIAANRSLSHVRLKMAKRREGGAIEIGPIGRL